MEIYAFGSIVRGDIDKYSDVDLLILKDNNELLPNIDREQFSIYTFQRIDEIWREGNPFSWHLFTEGKCIFSRSEISYLQSIGEPNNYDNVGKDLRKFYDLFITSKESILNEKYSIDFDLSMIFLALRNSASCFALGCMNHFEFSRDSALRIGPYSIDISDFAYQKLKQSRILATRGFGERIENDELDLVVKEFPKIEMWLNKLLGFVK